MKNFAVVLSLGFLVALVGCGGGSSDSHEDPVTIEQVEATQAQINSLGHCKVDLKTTYEATTYKEYSSTTSCASHSTSDDYAKDAATLEHFRSILEKANKNHNTLSAQNEIKALLQGVNDEIKRVGGLWKETRAAEEASARNKTERDTLSSEASQFIYRFYKDNNISVDGLYSSYYGLTSYMSNDEYRKTLSRFEALLSSPEFLTALKSSAVSRFELLSTECKKDVQPRSLLVGDGTINLCQDLSDQQIIDVLKAQVSKTDFDEAQKQKEEIYSGTKLKIDCFDFLDKMEDCVQTTANIYGLKEKLKAHPAPVDVRYHASSTCQGLTSDTTKSYMIWGDFKAMNEADVLRCLNESGDIQQKKP